ncbi:MAG: hypothetical protein KC656_17640, partial [Myxococcales bacterium]|nr:hypothetical protein [Myxococcales bacterium]
AAGIFLNPRTGLDSADTPLTDLELDIAARTFGFVASSMGVGTSVSEFSIFHASRGTMVAATDAGSNTFVAGRWARIQGSRGVFLTLGGTCPETGADPVGTLMADWF